MGTAVVLLVTLKLLFPGGEEKMVTEEVSRGLPSVESCEQNFTQHSTGIVNWYLGKHHADGASVVTHECRVVLD